ncbi:MAG: hypothetical protein WBP61_13555 [Nocardioides sp.]
MPRRPDRFLLGAVLLIAAQLVFRGWALWGSWFYFDDLAFMSRAMDMPFGVDYLTESYGGHLMPAGFALAWVLTHWWVFDWAPWALTLLVLQAIASIGMYRLLVAMFGRRPLVLALLAGYLAWVFTLPAGIWWAAGINQIPFQISLAFGLTAFLAHLRTRRTLPLVLSVVWVVAGLLFYEKTVLVIGVYALVALCWFSAGRTPERIRGLWDDYRAAVVTFVLLGAGYLAVYAAYGLTFSPGETADVAWGPIAWNLVAVAMLPAIVGGPLDWQPLSVGSFADPSDVTMIASWVAAGLLVFYAWRSRTISKRAWSLVVYTSLSNVALLASARVGIVGPELAREYRYQTEAAVILVLAIGLALLPLRGAREENAVRSDAPSGYEDRRLVAGVTLAVVALAAFSSLRYVDLWQDRNPTRDYMANVESDLTSADSPVPLIDTGIPQTLLWSFRYPENTYSHLFEPWEDQMSFPRSSIDDLFLFDDQGRLAPVGVVPARAMEESERGGDCPYPLDGILRIPLDGPVIGGGWWIALDYESPTSTAFRLTAGEEQHEVEVPAGEHTAWFEAAGTFDEVRLHSAGTDSDLCVTGLTLGTPVPTAPRS